MPQARMGYRQFIQVSLATAAITLMSATSATAATLNVPFTKLSGLTGGTTVDTGVYRADLSDISFDISSIAIADSNSGVGGYIGKFSGFDLDAIKLSDKLLNNAADVKNLTGLSGFDFSPSKTVFTPGTQRPPVDTALFGTNNGDIDNSIATLQNFDGNSTTDSTAFGFVSLGDGGKVIFNLTNAVSTKSPLYLYIGEVGDNGEVANGQITVSDKPMQVPEPTSLAALCLFAIYAKNRTKKTIQS